MEWLTAILVVTSSALGSLGNVPQIARTFRLKDASGVSISGEVGFLVICIGFVAYAVHLRSLPLLGTTVPEVLLLGTLSVLALRHGGVRDHMWVPAAMTVVFVAVLALGGWTAFSLALTGGTVTAFAPSVWAVWTEERIRGVSAVTWWLYTGYGLAWASLGVIESSRSVVFNGGVTAAMSLAVLVGLWVRRSHREEPGRSPRRLGAFAEGG